MSELDPTIVITERVEKRWRQLNGVVLETVTEGLKYLNVVHLAGMAGVLSFMGATKATGLALVLAFACFFLGAAAVGFCYLYRLKHFSALVNGWNDDTRDHFSGGMEWSDVVERDHLRSRLRHDFGMYVAIAAYVLILLGGIAGFMGVYQHASSGVH
ncbi:hypothetical protein BLA6993_05514 [Burkholderia lata]|uniref:hypothetical protein n=1 Tax=Burkholderia lata (strain ATCC 17760 / DSM 23089 / LMG 22485 / NCIMB 9086 / R18194 / 383) TaxID=482957 RepID=UPI0014532221|nr:hypothetical protein [Burkholderia lata]VWC14446.1 hypothetical protein BLA6993_05514 [Burkholderia lata]